MIGIRDNVKLAKLKLSLKVAKTKNSREKIKKQASDISEDIGARIKSLALDKFAINKRNRLLELGESYDKANEMIEYINNMENSTIMNISKGIKNMFVDSRYVGLYAGQILEKIRPVTIPKEEKKEERKQEVQKKVKESKPNETSSQSKKSGSGLKLNINRDTFTKAKADDVNEKIYKYLIDSGEIEIANYVLDLMTSPDIKRVSDSPITPKDIRTLTMINSGILEKLKEIEDKLNKQDTSITIPDKLEQVKKAKEMQNTNKTEESGSLWGYIMELLGSFFGPELFKLFRMGMKVFDFSKKLLEIGWDFVKTKVDDLIRLGFDTFIKPIRSLIDALPTWDGIVKFVEDLLEPVRKFITNLPDMMKISKSIDYIKDVLKVKFPDMSKELDKALEKNLDKDTEKGSAKISESLLEKTDNADIDKKIQQEVEKAPKTTSKEVEKALAKEIGPTAASQVGKETGEVLGKKIPFIGLSIAAALATSRASEGDYTGAALEGLSGLVSMVPLIGTAASLGVDSYLMYRDFNKDEYGDDLLKLLDEEKVIDKGWFNKYEIKDWNKLKLLSKENLQTVLNKGEWDEETRKRIQDIIDSKSDTFKYNQMKEEMAKYGIDKWSQADIDAYYKSRGYNKETNTFAQETDFASMKMATRSRGGSIADSEISGNFFDDTARRIRYSESNNSYSKVTGNDAGAGISFGAYQLSERAGNLEEFLKRMADGGDSEAARFLSQFTSVNGGRVFNGDRSELAKYLSRVGSSDLGKGVQDSIYRENFAKPAMELALRYGVKEPAAIAQIIDHYLNAGPGGASAMLQIANSSGDLSAEGIRNARLRHYRSIAQSNPSKAQYLSAWEGRVNESYGYFTKAEGSIKDVSQLSKVTTNKAKSTAEDFINAEKTLRDFENNSSFDKNSDDYKDTYNTLIENLRSTQEAYQKEAGITGPMQSSQVLEKAKKDSPGYVPQSVPETNKATQLEQTEQTEKKLTDNEKKINQPNIVVNGNSNSNTNINNKNDSSDVRPGKIFASNFGFGD